MRKLSTFLSCVLLVVIAITFAGCGDDDNSLVFFPVAKISITPTSLPDGAVAVAYSQTLTATGGTAPYTWSVSAGTLPAGLGLDAATGIISGTPTAAGTSSFTVTVTDSATTPRTASLPLSITIGAIPGLTITTTSLPSVTVGTLYSQTLVAAGGTTPYTWSISAGTLPAGLVLDAATGVISGTPTSEGTSSFTVTVSDASVPVATDSQALSITVSPVGSLLTISTTTVPAATFGTAYNQTLAATGGTPPYTWSISAGALPAGITLSAAGVLSGAPLVSGGPFNFTVMVTDSAAPANTATQALSLTVSISASVLSGKTLYDGNCAGCHSLGAYDPSGSPNLGGVSLAIFNGTFGGGSTHNGETLTATGITDMFAFTSLF